MNLKRVAIIGASGYSGEELVRLLLKPFPRGIGGRDLAPIRGQTLAQVFPQICGPLARKNVALHRAERRTAREAGGRGVSRAAARRRGEYAMPLLDAGRMVIDLSADFRLRSARCTRIYAHDHSAPDLLDKAVYGLPEIYRDENTRNRCSLPPGLLPDEHPAAVDSAADGGVDPAVRIIADSLSGVSGAGRKAEADYLFANATKASGLTACRSTGICRKSRNNFRSPPKPESPSSSRRI